MERARSNGHGRRLATPRSMDAAVKSICGIMRRSNCAGALQYVPELTWILEAVNPHAKRDEDLRTPEELLDISEAKSEEVGDAVAAPRKLL